jgi:hypothetical protein
MVGLSRTAIFTNTSSSAIALKLDAVRNSSIHALEEHAFGFLARTRLSGGLTRFFHLALVVSLTVLADTFYPSVG